MLTFSSRAAVMLVGALLVCGWLEWKDEIHSRALALAGLGGAGRGGAGAGRR